MEWEGALLGSSACAMDHNCDEVNQSQKETQRGSGAGWEGPGWLHSRLPQSHSWVRRRAVR
jgi:hypothetical protein